MTNFNKNIIAQPIIINKNYDHKSIIESSALISYFTIQDYVHKNIHNSHKNIHNEFNDNNDNNLRSLNSDNNVLNDNMEIIDYWSHNGHRKTVRSFHTIKAVNNYGFTGYPFQNNNKNDGKTERTVKNEHNDNNVNNDFIAASTLPMRMIDYPAKIRKARVTGWEPLSILSLPNLDKNEHNIITFYINGDINMSTGKLSAQCAHALHDYVINKNIVNLPRNTRLRLETVSETFLKLKCESFVIDNGLTEIPAGTITIGWE